MDLSGSRFTFKLSLRATLVLCVVLPLVAVIGLISVLLLSTFETRVEERMKEDVQLVARALEIPVAQALERGRVDHLQGALESAIGINRVYGAYVYDLEGETISSTGPSNHAADESGLARMAESGDRQGRYDEVSGRNVYSYFVPLTGTGGMPMGLLHVTRRERDIRASVADLRLQVALLALGAVMLVGGLVLYGHRGSVGRHLARIRQSMQRVKDGERAHRAPADGPVELAELAAALNAMLDGVEQAEREVHASREEQRSLRDRLRQAEKLAAIGTLAAGVAHELGTPLSVIAGKSQRLLRRRDLSVEVRGGLHDVSDEVRRMEHIVRQLLDFGRRSAPDCRRVGPRALISAAAQSLEDEAARAGVRVRMEGPDSDRKIEVDPLRVEQALTNLLGNAIDAAPGGHVAASWSWDGELVSFSVEDDGPGVEEGIRDRIFDPFFTTKEVGRGTGLGLAVVHGIAEEHGGRVELERSPMGGARFVLRLPTTVTPAKSDATARDLEARHPEARDPAEEASGRPPRQTKTS